MHVWLITVLKQTSKNIFTFDSADNSKIFTSSATEDSSLVKIHWKNLRRTKRDEKSSVSNILAHKAKS